MRRLLTTALLISAYIPAAQAMTVAEFLAKSDAVKAKGMLAMMSSDLTLLRNEMKSVSTAYRADIDAAQKAGKPPHSCPPPKGKASISSDDVMAELQSLPTAEKARTSVKTAFYAMMKKRYPCGK